MGRHPRRRSSLVSDVESFIEEKRAAQMDTLLRTPPKKRRTIPRMRMSSKT
jgi:hypothetical protein